MRIFFILLLGSWVATTSHALGSLQDETSDSSPTSDQHHHGSKTSSHKYQHHISAASLKHHLSQSLNAFVEKFNEIPAVHVLNHHHYDDDEHADSLYNEEEEKEEGNHEDNFDHQYHHASPHYGHHQHHLEYSLHHQHHNHGHDYKGDYSQHHTGEEHHPTRLLPCPMLYTRVGHRCIAIVTIAQVPWWDAKSFCESIFGELLAFHGIQDYFEFLNHLQITSVTSDLWIGGKTEGRSWKWIDRSTMPMGSPYWAIKSNSFSSWSGKKDTYSQAPSPIASFGLGVYNPRCASMSSKYFFYMSDEDCEDLRSPVCVLNNGAEVVVLKEWVEGSGIPLEVVTPKPEVVLPLTPHPPESSEESSEEGSGEVPFPSPEGSIEGSGDVEWFDELYLDSE